MIKALFFKEWIKLRYFWCIPFIFAGAALADYHLTFKGVLSMHGAVDTWNGLIFKESIYFASLQWAFILGGIWLASVQMAPECVGKRLRLLFHLPVNAIPALAVQAVTGLGLMALVFCAASAGFALINNHHGLPPELSVPMFKTLLPWGMAGLTSWCATAAAIADPSFKRKICFALAGFAYVTMLTGGRGFTSMSNSIWLYAAACLPWIPAVAAAALRVKEGE